MTVQIHSARTVVVLALFNAVISALVPPVLREVVVSLTTADEIILGFIVFAIGSLLEVLYYQVQLRDRAARVDIVWDAHEAVDALLSNMRKSMRTLENGVDPATDIFLRYFRRRIRTLEGELRQTANTRELRVDSQNLDLSEPLLESFTGLETDVIRIIHKFSDNDALFNVHEAQWFYRVYRTVASRRIIEVRRLLVYRDRAEQSQELSLRLMRFLTHAPHYDYRLLSESDLERLARSFRLNGEFIDFGIYGARYLFRGLVYGDHDFVGMYSREPNTIEHYTQFFDYCWSGPTAYQLDASALEPIAVETLFDVHGTRWTGADGTGEPALSGE